MRREMTWIGAIGLVVGAFVLAMPLAAATTVQTAAGQTDITSDTACTAGIAGPNPWQTSYSHSDDSDVVIPMDTSWIDERSGTSNPAFESWFKITAVYQGSTTSTSDGPHTTTGNTQGSGSMSHTVHHVRVGTSMDVTYEVWVHRQSDSPGVNLCYTSVQKTYSFTL